HSEPRAVPPSAGRRVLAHWLAQWRRVGWRTLYLFTSFPITLVVFSVLVTLVCAGVPLIVVWVGIPILLMTFGFAAGAAWLERKRLRWCGAQIDTPSGPRPDATGPDGRPAPRPSPFRRALAQFRTPARYREVLHGIAAFPLSTITWSVIVVGWVWTLYGLTAWFLDPWLSRLSSPDSYSGIEDLARLWHIPLPGWLFALIWGVIGVIVMPWITQGLATAHVWLGRGLLAPTRGGLRHQVERLEASRASASAAENSQLRQIERNIHDGPQQRLLRLGMDLATAQRRLKAGDTTAVAEILAGARGQSEATINELRSLATGFAPPILTDLGLVAALTAAVADSPVPASLTTDLPDQLGGDLAIAPVAGTAGTARTETPDPFPEQARTAVYFTVAEALANVAKHSGAAHARVALAWHDGTLSAQVSDDGNGRAAIVHGHGLAGLHDRAVGALGKLTVDSVPGTGTTVTIEVPCALS
ncbi:MAG: sensor domain-containing protein, partial [Bifidobacteriaceae bacterium]|nr:sensor domain-containing protein [Bifidobacteriaceae bacterium]